MTLLEVAIEGARDVEPAQAAGADRLELCCALETGGLTPSVGTIEAAVGLATVPVVVLVRPRPGDFVLEAGDLDVMLRDVGHARAAGAEGVVLGCLQADGQVDLEATQRLLGAARPMQVTFHRALDVARDVDKAFDALLGLGIDRVLSSGGRARALEGAGVLRRLQERGGSELELIAGGGVRAGNVLQVIREAGVGSVHVGARERIRPHPRTSGQDVSFASAALAEDEWTRTRAEAIGQVRRALDARG